MWYQRRFQYRCERIANILNRPAFCFVREAGAVPFPPHAGLTCGQVRWNAAFRTWRDYGYLLGAALGFCEVLPQRPPDSPEPGLCDRISGHVWGGVESRGGGPYRLGCVRDSMWKRSP